MNNRMVSIDFWNTLVDAGSNGEQRQKMRLDAVRDISNRHGMVPSDAAIQQANEAVTRRFDAEWIDRQRTLTTAELVRHMLEALKVPATPAEQSELVEAFMESFFAGPPKPAEGVDKALAEISSYYHLAIISDTRFSPGSVLRRYLEKLDLIRYFSAFAFSDELGVSKPHPTAYSHVLEATSSRPASSWHIGDMQRTDIEGAKAMGMKSILYTGFSTPDSENTTADFHCDKWNLVSDIVLSEI
ncbi:HAD family hydrolase [Balneolales bacterium ANBcel1]|nr:HAD family hydrolase [Balneolales bacterium ANBcel1]